MCLNIVAAGLAWSTRENFWKEDFKMKDFLPVRAPLSLCRQLTALKHRPPSLESVSSTIGTLEHTESYLDAFFCRQYFTRDIRDQLLNVVCKLDGKCRAQRGMNDLEDALCKLTGKCDFYRRLDHPCIVPLSKCIMYQKQRTIFH